MRMKFLRRLNPVKPHSLPLKNEHAAFTSNLVACKFGAVLTNVA